MTRRGIAPRRSSSEAMKCHRAVASQTFAASCCFRMFRTMTLDGGHGPTGRAMQYSGVQHRIRLSFAKLAFTAWMAGTFSNAGAERFPNGFSSNLDEARGTLEYYFKGRKLLAYAFATNQFKPYVRELYSLTGENVLLDAPPDHLHHHGLMFAVRVNGVNFWEERDQPGHEVHVKLLDQRSGWNTRELPEASFTELIHWVPHGDESLADTTPAAFLIERRALTLSVNESAREVSLAWHGEFEVGARTNRVQLHGSDYNGLGLRLPASWNRVARHQNSENAPYVTGGKRDVFPARWSTVSPGASEDDVQVALFARPAGHPGTNAFFSMTDPFTYLSATIRLDQKPLELRAGDHFSLDYLVLVYPTRRTPEQMERRYQAWVGELK